MTGNNHIDEVLETAMKNIKSIVDVNTVIGKPFTGMEGTTIVPISKVMIGFVAGGGEYGENTKFQPEFPFAGGSGGAVSLSPVGFLVGDKSSVRMIEIEEDNASKFFDLAKNVFEQFARKQ